LRENTKIYFANSRAVQSETAEKIKFLLEEFNESNKTDSE